MAMLCLHPSPLFFSSPPPSSSSSSSSPLYGLRRRLAVVGFAVFSSHSNPRFLKSGRRSRHGRRTPPYGDDAEEEEGESKEEEFSDDDDFSDLEYHGAKLIDADLQKFNLSKPFEKPGREKKQSKTVDLDSIEKLKNETKVSFQKLQEELDFDEKWFPLIDYLSTFGLKESHFVSIYERHMPCLQINLASAKERLGFLNSKLSNGQIIAATPSLFSYSVEHSLKPTIRYLIEEVGVKESDVSKIVHINKSYSGIVIIIGGNLKPKYLYLVNELRNEVQSLTKYPMYLSLSLEQRIRPRHKFLVSLKKVPKGPFPLSSLVPTDVRFCQQWAGTTLENYLAFRQNLLLTDFAKKLLKLLPSGSDTIYVLKAWLLIFLHTKQWGCNDVLPGANLFVRIKMQLKLLHQSYAMRIICLYEILAATILSSLVLRTNFHSGVVLLDS
uniref:Uncharacterized protein n=1 Tax=Ananas comosus var. bracteatus TaxID=296719 RepID=A0A6V7Q3I5_ANACO|nr:unnamed protein product [Ananas comosus var. bracteatus]